MRLLPGIGAEFAAAVRRVKNAAALKAREVRTIPSLADSWERVESAVDAYCSRGERDNALSAIARWEIEAMDALGVKAGDRG